MSKKNQKLITPEIFRQAIIGSFVKLNPVYMMKNPVIHDFVTLLFVYNDVMKVSATKKARNRKMEEICHLFCDEDGRIKRFTREYCVCSGEPF